MINLCKSGHRRCFVKKMFRKKNRKIHKETTVPGNLLSRAILKHLFYRTPPGDCFFLYQEISLREFISLVVVKLDVSVKSCKSFK